MEPTGKKVEQIMELFSNSSVRLTGPEIARQTGMLSGTMYPVLLKLERAGWLESEWEEASHKAHRSRIYRLGKKR